MRHLYRTSRLLCAVHVLCGEGQTRTYRFEPLKRLISPRNAKTLTSYRTRIFTSPWPSIGSIDNCVYGALTKSIREHAEAGKTAMVTAENPEHRYSYKELLNEIKALEGFLHDIGFKNGDVTTSVLGNCIEFPVIFIATIGRGGAFSGASAQFNAEEIARQFRDSNTTIAFTSEKYLSKVLEAADYVNSVKKVVCIRDFCFEKELPSHPKLVFWADAVSSTTVAPKPTHNLQDVAVLPYSSGTTGIPKGVELTHINFLTAVIGYKNHSQNVIRPKIAEHFGSFPMSGNLVLYLPFYHVYGKVTLMALLLKGDTAVVMNRMDPTLFYKCIEEYKPWCLYIVPPVAHMLVKDPNTSKYDFSSAKYAVSGAAPLGKDLAEQFQKKFPGVFLTQAYGMSETSLCSFLPPCEEYGKYEHVGRVAPEFEAKIVDVATGEELDVNQTGELCLRSQAVMKGYLGRPDATAEVIDKDGWFHTGDVGYFNEKGEMHIVDRIKELIKVKGLQVAPAELESVLLGYPRIHDVAVIGVPHDDFGEVPRAFVVKADPSLKEDEVKQIIVEKLAKYKRLEGGVQFISQIPKSPAGKILRRELKEMKL